MSSSRNWGTLRGSPMGPEITGGWGCVAVHRCAMFYQPSPSNFPSFQPIFARISPSVRGRSLDILICSRVCQIA